MEEGIVNNIKYIRNIENEYSHGTAAPGFHLSDTLDWSCYSARIKNQVITVRKPVYKYGKVEHAAGFLKKPF